MNPRRLIVVLGACACLCLAGAQCSSPKVMDLHGVGDEAITPELSYRLSPYWIRKATKVKAGDCSVYFRGKADPPVRELAATQWSGTITGDVLIVTRKSATVCTNLKIAPDGAIHFAGKSHMEAKDPPNAWGYLIPR